MKLVLLSLPQKTCFVHFSVGGRGHHISQFGDEHIKLIPPFFLTQIPGPAFRILFFREIVHFKSG